MHGEPADEHLQHLVLPQAVQSEESPQESGESGDRRHHAGGRARDYGVPGLGPFLDPRSDGEGHPDLHLLPADLPDLRLVRRNSIFPDVLVAEAPPAVQVEQAGDDIEEHRGCDALPDRFGSSGLRRSVGSHR